MLKYQIFKDGNMYFATSAYFINIQESHAEFDETPYRALEKYLEWESNNER